MYERIFDNSSIDDKMRQLAWIADDDPADSSRRNGGESWVYKTHTSLLLGFQLMFKLILWPKNSGELEWSNQTA